ncbi:MAG: ABC transporter substrate-binding protein [Acetobacteraceae bacterium]|nr:ABC transporter substrate-binding protein [Acetobacteraceae bacterium]
MRAAASWLAAVWLLVGLLAPLSVRADPLPPAAVPVKALGDALLQSMRTGASQPFEQRFDRLAPVIDRAFDLNALLRACVGPRWASLSPRDQAALSQVFHRFMVASYVANFANYKDEKFEILPEQRAIGADQVVATQFVGQTGEGDTRIDYVMHDNHGTWKAVDVLLDGTISRVAVQRSDFRRVLDSSGVNGLVGSLEKKIAAYQAGAND